MADEITTIPQKVTYVQVIDQPRPQVAELSDLVLEGEPGTDRGYITPDGTRFRARIVKMDEQAASAPTNGSASLAPSSMTLSLSLALIDDNNSVVIDGDGNLVIMDRHEILLSDEMMKNPDADIKADIERILREEAFLLEKRVTKRAEIQDYLASTWGGAVAPAPAEVQPFVPPTE